MQLQVCPVAHIVDNIYIYIYISVSQASHLCLQSTDILAELGQVEALPILVRIIIAGTKDMCGKISLGLDG